MKTVDEILGSALKTLDIEAKAVAGLREFIDQSFADIVQRIAASEGRLVVTGIGKSANIANKIVATLNSTGTPAIFMHAADAIHGDLGNVQRKDLVLCISKSGNTPEIKSLVPLLKSMGNTVIGMVGNMESWLADHADLVLNTTVQKEACPNDLAPTSSTTAQLAMGDALAVCLMEVRGFSDRDFAKYHPGGALGKKLYLKLSDLLGKERLPAVEQNTPVKDVIVAITSGRVGATAVTDGGVLMGIITDGDLRRMLQRHENIDALKASDIMSAKPKTMEQNELLVTAFSLMEQHNISQLVVTDGGAYAGIVHLHDILKEGIF